MNFKEPAQEEDAEMEELLNKMHGLSVKERPYALHYAQCLRRYPELTRILPAPEIVRDSPASAYSYQASGTSPPPSPSIDNPDIFF